jgi:alanyl-tRNA synthetase
MNSRDVRQKYLDFFKSKNHVEIKPARIVLDNDSTTLFTSSGMQPLVPYLLGETHPDGIRLVDSQPSFRSGDIEEVGDNRHTTFFEMLGNWSLGDYFKKEEITWLFEFLTKELSLPVEKLHITCFEGNNAVPKDEEAAGIWKSLGISEERIYFYSDEKNWWSKSGMPDQMPVGEIGGPDTEVFYEFTEVKHDVKFGEKCHPNCDCGRFMEICNSVFIQYKKTGDNEFETLQQKNVDFGGGLERITAATIDTPDIFEIDLFQDIIRVAEEISGKKYSDEKTSFRVIADHLRAATFIILDGVIPANKLQGYILRRLLRRSAVKLKELSGDIKDLSKIATSVLEVFDGLFEVSAKDNSDLVRKVIDEEMDRFGKTLDKGLKEIEKISEIDGKIAFDLYQTYGFPYEVTEELFRQKGQEIDREQFKAEFEKHRDLSRTASVGMFKGGLAGHSETEIKYHTATHLLHQALRDVLGPEVFQKGSNINEERLRFDFNFDRKMTEEEIKKTEDIINERIKQDLKVDREFISVPEAQKLNAIGLFTGKYDETVSIYKIGPNFTLNPEAKDQRDRGGYYSAEFCGGPHVEHTKVIGGIKIVKEEAVSAGIRRIYAELM